ncbi:hypothetical protein AGLY_003217 [Aphis glycines]|uniref:THAP9-like helix-turn-helix domain-containing protein n=1 Tax=Aphis glycines TaxID=307491 RepID=A0A6G0U503_APHGL|nr:hypothetical protein AGLY_003217 [Aphis glycines]
MLHVNFKFESRIRYYRVMPVSSVAYGYTNRFPLTNELLTKKWVDALKRKKFKLSQSSCIFNNPCSDQSVENIELASSFGNSCYKEVQTILPSTNEILTNKGFMDEESNNFITNNFDGNFITILNIYKNECKNNGKAIGGQYTHQMKGFALTLHYYSARADNYCWYLPDTSSIDLLFYQFLVLPINSVKLLTTNIYSHTNFPKITLNYFFQKFDNVLKKTILT